MKIVIPGGTGQVGTILSRGFHAEGHEVLVLSRHRVTVPWRWMEWDGQTLGPWASELDGSDVVINLAGRSVDCRYTRRNRQQIYDSRILSTRCVAEATGTPRRPPRLWLQASTATIYAHRYDGPNDEAAGILGGEEEQAPDSWHFSIEVAKAWEREIDDADLPNTRKVKLRSAMVMSADRGGVFDRLLGLARFGLGGRAGDGQQYVSWIHAADFVRAIHWLIENDTVEGAVNLASPNPLPNADFVRALREAAGIKLGLPLPKWVLECGAILMRTETELLLKSRRVVPGRLLADGFDFRFPSWRSAAKSLWCCWRLQNQGNLAEQHLLADR